MAVNPVCWWEICTEDAGKLAEFYHNVFGWEVKKDEQTKYTVLKSGDGTDGGIGGGLENVHGGVKPYLTIYIQVEDCDAAVEKLKEHGANVFFGPKDFPGVGRVAMFNDPQGHMLGVMKYEEKAE
jgi:predicted enzyme related to lactoylglutathione lyase